MSSSPGEIITTSQMATVMKRVTKSIGGATVKGLRTAAHVAKARAVQSIGEVPTFNSDVKFIPVDFGEMRRSYTVENVPDGAILENQAAHAAIQEFGTRPFTPPMAPLEEWAKRKIRRASTRKRGKRKKAAGGDATAAKVEKPAVDRGDRDIFAAVKGAQTRADRKAAREADMAKQAKALARKAFNSIRLHGVKAKGFHSHASQYFGGYVADALAQRISKVTK